MRQVLAIFLDTLRHLRSKSLFWICLAISALAAFALFGTYSFNDQGIRFLWFKTTSNPALTAGSPGSRLFVSSIFSSVFVLFWLSWGATILAVVSTAGILPEFLAGGAIDLALARPITRAKLFLSKFASAMVFTLAQVVIGVGVAYLIIGIKMDWWMHGALVAVPAIVLQFFYLYAVSALIAVVTRSTIASLIGTLLFWFMVFIVQFSADQMKSYTAQIAAQAERAETRAEALEKAAREAGDSFPASLRDRIDRARADASEHRQDLDQVRRWERLLSAGQLVVPKTRDTQKVISNATAAPTGIEFFALFSRGNKPPPNMSEEEWNDLRESSNVGEKAMRDINIYTSLGTSLGFTVLVLAGATLIFSRRDF